MKNQAKQTVLFLLLAAALASCSRKEIYAPSPSTLYGNNAQLRLVPEPVAMQIAKQFNPRVFLSNNEKAMRDIATLQGTMSATGKNDVTMLHHFDDSRGVAAFYVAQFANSKGFLIISADSGLSPIMAYVPKGNFTLTNAPGGFVRWVNQTVSNVEFVRSGKMDTKDFARPWVAYRDQMNGTLPGASKVAVNGNRVNNPPVYDPCAQDPNYYNVISNVQGPLVQSTWGQADGYNDACPFMSCGSTMNGRAFTGCVATAMAQVIRYWQFPTRYNYANMPLTTGSTDIQGLMSDIGTSVSMSYGCSGSGASQYNIAPSLTGTFGYSTASISGYSHSSYGTIEYEISFGRPVLLTGYDSGPTVGHEWVCDGYMQTTIEWCDNGTLHGVGYADQLHMNWGWDGSYNGWFVYSNWTVAGMDFNYYNNLVYNIHP